MLLDGLKERLKANWGPMCEAMECFAEGRLYDAKTGWECYLLGMSLDEEELCCLINGRFEYVNHWDLMNTFNDYGEYLTLDKSFRKRKAIEIFKRMRKDG